MITVDNPLIGWHTFAVFGTISADQEDPDFPVANLANPATYLQWRALDSSEQSIVVTLPETQAADYLAVYGHNWGSQGTTVHIESSTNGGGSWSAVGPPTIPDELDRVFFRTFDSVSGNAFRVRLVPLGGSGDDPPEAAVLYFGRVLQIPRRIYVGHTPLPFGREARMSSGMSANGQFLGRVLESISYQTDVALDFLTPEWIRANFDPFVRACITRPFFWSWRPGAYDTEAGIAWFSGRLPTPSNSQSNGMMAVSWSMQGLTLPPHFRAASSSASSGSS